VLLFEEQNGVCVRQHGCEGCRPGCIGQWLLTVLSVCSQSPSKLTIRAPQAVHTVVRLSATTSQPMATTLSHLAPVFTLAQLQLRPQAFQVSQQMALIRLMDCPGMWCCVWGA